MISRLVKDFPDLFVKNVSYTTRKPRNGEVSGVDRFFVSVAEFEEEIEKKNFIEFARFADNYYGTNKHFIQKVVDSGRICVIEVEIEGWKSISHTDMECNFIYVLPPSMEELTNRLIGRGSESEESLKKRIEIAKGELHFVQSRPDLFPHLVVNNDFELFYREMLTTIRQMYPGISLG